MSRNPQSSDAPAEPLAALLLSSLQALADAGNAELACRLAGQACVALRKQGQGADRRFNVLLHRLTPQLSW